MKKLGRNDPCPCGSGKKFKKCCEAQNRRGQFSASRIDPSSTPGIQKVAGLTNLFHSATFSIPKKPMPEESLDSNPGSVSEEKTPDKNTEA